MTPVMPASHNEEFMKGKTKGLGVGTIILAILQIILESVLLGIRVYGLSSFISYWGPVFYIIGGALAIAASNKLDIGLVKAAMAFNIITTILSIIALILSIVNIASFSVLLEHVCSSTNDLCWRVIAGIAINAIILVTNVLLIGISITISVYAGRASRQPQMSNQVFVIQNQTMAPVAQGGPAFYPPYTQQPQVTTFSADQGKGKPAS